MAADEAVAIEEGNPDDAAAEKTETGMSSP